jgi:hypothetical protein
MQAQPDDIITKAPVPRSYTIGAQVLLYSDFFNQGAFLNCIHEKMDYGNAGPPAFCSL